MSRERLESRRLLSGNSSHEGTAAWILEMDPAAGFSDQELVQVLREDHRLEVVRGLGRPGLVLARAEGQSDQAVSHALARDARIHAFERDGQIQATALFPNEVDQGDFDQQYGLHNSGVVSGAALDADIDAPEAWSLTTGSRDVVVAVLDTGVDYTHADLYQNIWINQGEIPDFIKAQITDTDGLSRITFADLNADENAHIVVDRNDNGIIDAGDILDADSPWIDGVDADGNGRVDDLIGWDFHRATGSGDTKSSARRDPMDQHGHGTHVAGIIASQGNNELGTTGVTWEASLLVLKFLNEENSGFTSDAIEAINYLIDLKDAGTDIRLVNNSWQSQEGFSTILRGRLAEAGRKEILFVVGAGNGDFRNVGVNNDLRPVYPASYNLDNVISVAASAADDTLVPFFNFGPTTVDLAAPGLGIYSTRLGGGYQSQNGTSFSTAFVTGTAALLLSIPDLPKDATAVELRDAILSSVDAQCVSADDPLCSHVGKTATSGRLNVHKALQTDTFSPRASASDALQITTRGQHAFEIEILVQDDNPLDIASFGGSDFVVRRNGTTDIMPLQFLRTVETDNASTLHAIYRWSAPVGGWTDVDNGEYEILVGNYTDAAENRASATSSDGVVGVIHVSVPFEGQIVVDSTTDGMDSDPGDGQCRTAEGTCTLRAAVMESNATAENNTIVLVDETYRLTISGTMEDDAETGDLDIRSQGGRLTIVGGESTVLRSAQDDRVFDVHTGATLSLTGFRLTSVDPTAQIGGLVHNRGAVDMHGLELPRGHGDERRSNPQCQQWHDDNRLVRVCRHTLHDLWILMQSWRIVHIHDTEFLANTTDASGAAIHNFGRRNVGSSHTSPKPCGASRRRDSQYRQT